MPALFVDPLDLWLMLLGSTLLFTIYWVYANFVSGRSEEEVRGVNRTMGYFYFSLGLYALATGVWATAVWPLPGPYNIVLMDPWALFGVALIAFGLANIYGFSLIPLLYGVSALSFPVAVYGVAIWVKGLTREPIFSGLMFFALGLAGLVSPMMGYYGRRVRALPLVVIVLLFIAGIISLWTGVNAAFGHIDRWQNWFPWYGVVTVQE